ncbi:MAG: aminotransferase class III-fold pyridoxal phosphate-dependent enzyme [Actinomycetota bacterium]
MTNFWHAFADMHAVSARGPFVLDRGEGVHVWDEAGTRYLDATAGLWFANVGFGRGEIADAARAQMAKLPAYSTFGDFSNRPVEDLADRVAAVAPVHGSKVFFTSGGSDSIDSVTKIARRFWQLNGQRNRTVFIKRQHAYHGMHTAGTSLAGIPANQEGFGELLGDVEQVPWDDAGALREAIHRIGAERVAAFFCEPVIGAGGVFPPPPGYLDSVREICRETGVLFIADEVITGFARCGDWFASSRFGLEPDLVTCAKGITSGYLPLGAVVAAPRVADVFFAEGAGLFRHGYTYSGHAAVAAAALANLDIIEREGLCDRALELEKELPEVLAPLLAHEQVDEIRSGTGVLAAVQLSAERIEADPSFPIQVVGACRANGVLTRALATGALQVSPSLVIDDAGLSELAEGLSAGLDASA